MKQCIVLLAAIILHASAHARIWRVNNMPGVTADFTTAQAAHNGAGAGDTIHLEPSVNNYGAVTCTKKLTWFSIGYFLPQNPGNQFSSTTGALSNMTFNTGSNSSVVSVVADGSFTINVPDITISRSFMNYIGLNPAATNTVISQCFITQYLSLGSTNTIVSNNIIYFGIAMVAGTTAIITNNVLNYGGRNENFFGPSNIYNSVFQNNISVKGGAIAFYNSVASYNMTLDATGLPAGNSNLMGVNMTNVFVNSVGTIDKDYLLKAGSLAAGAAYGGGDMGAYGGSTPFKLALQPAIPAITNLSSPSSTGGNTIQVTFSAKSNN